MKKTEGPNIHLAFFASFSPTQLSFSRPPICVSWVCWSENQVCSVALLAHCYFEAAEIDHAIDQAKPDLKSMAQCVFCYLNNVLVICAYRRVQTALILKMKGLQCKRLLM